MAIPITLSKTAQFRRPQGQAIPTATQFVNVTVIWNAASAAGSKKVKHLPTFWAFWQFQERLSAGVAFRQQSWPISVSLERLSEAKPGAPDPWNAQTKPGDRISGFWATPDEVRRRRSHEKGRSARAPRP
jgi:hypothetical protein